MLFLDTPCRPTSKTNTMNFKPNIDIVTGLIIVVMPILGFSVGIIAGMKTEQNAIMKEAFERGYAVPVKVGNDIKYEWSNPSLLGEPPALEQE